MNGLFGLELPTSVNFVIAFVVVLALIGAATWLVRRFGAPRLDAGARNRQPRLAVIDSAAVDGRRKLVIIRRDNVEHLLMVGGPTDVVVETNIVRSGAAVSPRGARRSRQRSEMLPRAMPLPDTTHWPLQPEPAVAAQARPERVQDAEPRAAAPTPRRPARPRFACNATRRPASPPINHSPQHRSRRTAGACARSGPEDRAGGADRSARRRRQRPEPRQHGASA